MKVLVVEDDNERIFKFSRELEPTDAVVYYAQSADGAATLLKVLKFDVIFLDHDLGGRAYVASSDPNTGYAVAKKIKGTRNESAYIIIHSLNPAGAENIKSLLPKAIIAPFTVLNIGACVEG
jgi:CheY-like chemotaxis protein